MKAWHHAVANAAANRRHLLVIIGTLLVSNEIVPPLLDVLKFDPLLAAVHPRFSNAATDKVHRLPAVAGMAPEGEPTSRSAVARLPESLMTAEMLSACFVVRRDVIESMDLADGFSSVVGSLMHALCQARRRGFRNVVANRLIVPSSLSADQIYPILPLVDSTHLASLYPDAPTAASDAGHEAQRRLEALLSAAYPDQGENRRLLLDCRGLSSIHNGTSQCVLGMLDGFAALQTGWQIEVLANAAASQFHCLAERYPHFRQSRDQIAGYYAAVFTLNQPWEVGTIAEVHSHGFLIGFNILDTIAWDILYVPSERLARTWRFVSHYSDMLTYISRFSQERFRFRFPVAPGVAERVVHLSLSANEQSRAPFHNIATEEHVLLFGNSYDHKGIEPALRQLTAAFPTQSFVVLGGRESSQERVRVIPSGTVSADEVHRLIATARAIVFPSFYEGFGLPVVEGLSYGRPVLVRKSELWDEIAAHSRFSGYLIEFEGRAELIDRLGQILKGSLPVELPSGVALQNGQAPTTWRDAAAAVLSLIDERLTQGSDQHWLRRDETLRLSRCG